MIVRRKGARGAMADAMRAKEKCRAARRWAFQAFSTHRLTATSAPRAATAAKAAAADAFCSRGALAASAVSRGLKPLRVFSPTTGTREHRGARRRAQLQLVQKRGSRSPRSSSCTARGFAGFSQFFPTHPHRARASWRSSASAECASGKKKVAGTAGPAQIRPQLVERRRMPGRTTCLRGGQVPLWFSGRYWAP